MDSDEERTETPGEERRRLRMEQETPQVPAPRKSRETQPRVAWQDPGPAAASVPPEETPERLKTRINALETERDFLVAEKVELEAQAARQNRRSQGGRMSGISTNSLQEHGVRPKLEKPSKFLGGYAELQNITHWIAEMEEYLEACGCTKDQFCSFAKSYMGPTVRDWMTARFPRTKASPTWDELVKALLERFLVADHEELLEIKFERARQGTRDYDTYIEYFQVLDAAIVTSQLVIAESRKVRRFIKGLTSERDRYSLLEKRPSTLASCYTALMAVKQAREQSGASPFSQMGRRQQLSPEGGRQASPLRRSLNKLQGKEKDQARKEGRCLNCGKAGHWIKECPDMKKTFKQMVAKEFKRRANKEVKRTHRRFNQLKLGTSEEDRSSEEDAETGEEDSSDSSEEEIEKRGGDADSEAEGNDSPRSQG